MEIRARKTTTATDAEGHFAFDGLAAGVYELVARPDGYVSSAQDGIGVFPGERREVNLFGEPESEETLSISGGVMVVTEEPLREVFDRSDLVALATVGPSVTVERKEDWVETELVITRRSKAGRGAAPFASANPRRRERRRGVSRRAPG